MTDPGSQVHERIVNGTQAAATAAPKAAGGKPSVSGHAAGGASKGAGAGAGIGMAVGGPPGAAIGAAAGGVLGGGAGAVSGHKAKTAWNKAQRGPGRQIVVMEFVICMVILALSPLTDKHKTEGPGAFMRRGSAVCALFLVLALLSAGGPRAGRIAAGFGGVVTMALLVSSRDVFVVLAKKFNSSKDGPAGPGDGDIGEALGEGAGEAAGEVAAILNRMNPPAEAGPLGNGIR